MRGIEQIIRSNAEAVRIMRERLEKQNARPPGVVLTPRSPETKLVDAEGRPLACTLGR